MSYEIKSPMPAKILAVHVKVGDSVNAGDEVATIESMKMEMPVEVDQGGTISAINIEPDMTVAKDATLIVID